LGDVKTNGILNWTQECPSFPHHFTITYRFPISRLTTFLSAVTAYSPLAFNLHSHTAYSPFAVCRLPLAACH
jgi:hypothetical protein